MVAVKQFSLQKLSQHNSRFWLLMGRHGKDGLVLISHSCKHKTPHLFKGGHVETVSHIGLVCFIF
jgi:hypothetical protein